MWQDLVPNISGDCAGVKRGLLKKTHKQVKLPTHRFLSLEYGFPCVSWPGLGMGAPAVGPGIVTLLWHALTRNQFSLIKLIMSDHLPVSSLSSLRAYSYYREVIKSQMESRTKKEMKNNELEK